MKQKLVFFANDDTPFNTPAEALAHDAKLETAAQVDAFLSSESSPYKGAQASIARNAILGFVAYQASVNSVDTPTEEPAPVLSGSVVIEGVEAVVNEAEGVHAASAPHDEQPSTTSRPRRIRNTPESADA